jgi:hypothetical protein
VEVEFGQMEDVKGQIIIEMIDKNRASTSIVIGRCVKLVSNSEFVNRNMF